MKNLLYFFVLFLAGSFLTGCGNTNPGHSEEQSDQKEAVNNDVYRMVYVLKDGSEDIEKFDAKNDTDAVFQFTQKVSAIAMKSLGEKEPPFKKVYVLSPAGDTLNRNEALLKAAMKADLEKMADEADSMSNELKRQASKM